jgi:N-acetylglucosaminyl-diphospho-decaprenol L-rhamnosyltransferase
VMADGRAPSELQRPADIRLGVVVVNYRSSALLAANLERIDRGAIPSSTTVVVDNFSTAAERDAVRQLAHRRDWLLEEPDSNLGFGAGVNRGVRRAAEAGCNAFLLLNPDVVISPTTVSALVGAVPGHPHTALSPRLDMPDGSHGFDGARLDLRTGLTSYRAGHGDVGSDRWLTAACLLLTRCCWDLVGGFDEDYFLYWEDVDLTQRLLRAGGELQVLHDVVAVHAVGGTQGSDGKSTTCCRYMCRNRLLFACGHVGPRARLRWLWSAPRYAWRIARSELRRPSRAAATVVGTVEGTALVVRSLAKDAVRWSRDRRAHVPAG